MTKRKREQSKLNEQEQQIKNMYLKEQIENAYRIVLLQNIQNINKQASEYYFPY